MTGSGRALGVEPRGIGQSSPKSTNGRTPSSNGSARDGVKTSDVSTGDVQTDHAEWRTSRGDWEQLDPFAGGGEMKLKHVGGETGTGIQSWLMSLGGDRKVTRPYLQNSWVYACVSAVARAIGSLTVQFSEGEDDDKKTVETGELVDLFQAPNPLMSQAKFLKQLVNYHYLWGETYLILLKETTVERDDGGTHTEMMPVKALSGEGMTATVETPTEIWPVAGHLVDEMIDKTKGPLPHSYRVHANGGVTIYPAHAVVQISDANPHSVLRGVGPITAALRDIAKAYQIDRYDDALLKNGGTPGGVLSIDGPLRDDEVRAIREAWRTAQERPDSHRKTAILPHGTKYDAHGFSPHDMEFSSFREWIRGTIMAVTGVTKPIISITDQVSMANSREAYRVFWETTVMTLVRFFEDEINYRFMRRLHDPKLSKQKFSFDTSKVEALREDLDAKVERTIKLYKDAHKTFNESAKLAGWELGEDMELEGGDERWIPANLLPPDLAGVPLEPFGPAVKPTDSGTDGGDAGSGSSSSTTGGDAGGDAGGGAGGNAAVSANVGGSDTTANPKATLNGAQISSLLEIIALVVAGTITVETAVQVIVAAFPFDEKRAREILEDIEPGSSPPPAPGVPDDDSGPSPSGPPSGPPSDDEGKAQAALGRLLSEGMLTDRGRPNSADNIDAYWRAHDAFLRTHEVRFQRKVFGVYRDFLRSVERKLEEIAAKGRASVGIGKSDTEARYIVTQAELQRLLDINLDEWTKALIDAVDPEYLSTITGAAGKIHAEVSGAAGLLTGTDPVVLDFLATKHISIAEGWVSTLAESMQRKMVAVLAEAPANLQTLAQAIAEVLDELKDQVQIMHGQAGRRAMMIARTEITSASSFSRVEQMKLDGIEKHTWLTSRDNNVRNDHVDLNGKTVKVGAVFGHRLRYPGDPNGAAKNVIQCRCTTIPELPDKARHERAPHEPTLEQIQ